MMMLICFAFAAMFFCFDPRASAVARRSEALPVATGVCRQAVLALKAGSQVDSAKKSDFEQLLALACRRGIPLLEPLKLISNLLEKECKEVSNAVKHASLLKMRAFFVWAVCAAVASIVGVANTKAAPLPENFGISGSVENFSIWILAGVGAGAFLMLPVFFSLIGETGWFSARLNPAILPNSSDSSRSLNSSKTFRPQGLTVAHWVQSALLDEPFGAVKTDPTYMSQWQQQWQCGVSTRNWRLERLRDIAEEKLSFVARQRESFLQLMPLVEALSWSAACALLLGVPVCLLFSSPGLDK